MTDTPEFPRAEEDGADYNCSYRDNEVRQTVAGNGNHEANGVCAENIGGEDDD